jgi:Ser-tRNA(Ala) deacylase AlaX
MTRKLFWDDPYRNEVETRVTGVDGDRVTVAETVFFAESGGQESDAGTIGGHRVLEARIDGPEIVYVLEAGHGLAPGDAVRVVIDAARRRRLVRLHFAAGIVLELIRQGHGPMGRAGAHISEDKARIDFRWDGNIAGILPDIEEKARALVARDAPIESAFSHPAAERRFWRIEGFAQVDCGGTHPRTTGEVGGFRLKRKNPGRGLERVEIHLD